MLVIDVETNIVQWNPFHCDSENGLDEPLIIIIIIIIIINYIYKA